LLFALYIIYFSYIRTILYQSCKKKVTGSRHKSQQEIFSIFARLYLILHLEQK